MLQLISGKFFQTNTLEGLEIFNFEEIIYSNYHSYSQNINIKSGKIVPLKERDPIISLKPLKNFKNDTSIFLMDYLIAFEKKYLNEKGLMPAFPGNKEIIGSICNLLIFYFDALFSSHLSDIENLIYKGTKQYRFYKFTDRFTNQEIDCNSLMIEDFSDFVNNVIDIEQKTYAVILKSINAYVSAIKYHRRNPFLSYIMLIFALENLVSLFDDFEPGWHFVEADLRNSFENDIFPECSDDLINKMKAIFLSKKHYKLSQKFKDFCVSKIKPAFYMDESHNIIGAARESEIINALNGLYQIRSLFVHTLTISSPLSLTKYSSSEIFEMEGQHHFSFTGLLRITKHILKNCILDKSLVRLDVEPYEYFDHLPEFTSDLISLHSLPDSSHNQFHASQLNKNNSRAFLNNLLEQQFYSQVHHSPANSLLGYISRIPKDLHGINNNDEKIPLLILFELYFHFMPHEINEMLNYYSFSYDKTLLDNLTAETFLYKVILNEDISSWTALKLEECYKTYEKNKGKKNKNQILLNLNNYYELLLLASIANKYLEEENILKYAEIFNKLMRESPSNEYLLKLLDSISNGNFVHIDITCLKTSIYLQEYKKLSSENTKDRQQNLLNIARCYYKMEFYNDAIQLYSEIINIDPACVDAINDLANCYLKINNIEQAQSSILEALKVNDQLWYINETYANILFKNEDIHNSYRWYYRALNLNKVEMSKILFNKNLLEDVEIYCHNIIKRKAHEEHLQFPQKSSFENWLKAERAFLDLDEGYLLECST